MRADRLLSILLHLQVHQRITARELAQRLEVSERTIHRDMQALSVSGIPVTAERGAGGGWALLDEYRTNVVLNALTGLNPDEVQALFLTTPARVLSDLGLDKASEGAFMKLLAALPAMYRRNAEYASKRIYVDVTGWSRTTEEIPYLPVLLDAVWQARKLYVTYQRSDEKTVERLVDPQGLVAKGSVWYLVAAVDDEGRSEGSCQSEGSRRPFGSIRTYRVSRVRSARMMDQPCAHMPDFDLAAYWEQSKVDFQAALPRYPATLRVLPAALPRIRATWRYARIEHEAQPDTEGWVKLDVVFDVIEEGCHYVLSLGPQVEVLEPQELRDRVITFAKGVVALYEMR
ncbi:MAG: YafY family transcriptional regulator [Chloroflexi bacterium]|nr:YafY family transcriptional regulator [Chloroflexota bacterium]